ncbi:M16 family metallopeptidase [Alkalicoccus chagannorensis]|uniref:M16 family metallopeptidase n=1 Tax=Alkalicoccus chagannorensis TaxID=427072 RepID=UPI00041E2777|nr:pitrilysin family protein [Alkalicoccus chagannorensis]
MLQKTTLINGVRLLTDVDTRVRSVSMGIWVRIGSRYEKAEMKGMAHFIEHMIFKGTKERTAKEIAEAFDAVGGYVNAMTSKEYTAYYAKVLDTHASDALEVLADMFFHSNFDSVEMDKEKQVVKEEIDMYEDTPDDLVHEILAEAAYKNHALAAPILGTEETLDAFTREDILSFMKHHYGAEEVVLSLAGNVSPELVEHAQKLFEPLQPGERLPEADTPAFHPGTEIRKKETEQAHLCYGYEGFGMEDETLYPAVLINNVLGGNMSSRLFQEIREDRGLAYSVFSYHEAFAGCGMLTIYAGCQQENLDEVCRLIEQETAAIAADGLTERELYHAKEQLKGSLLLSLESSSAHMSRNAKNELLLGEHEEMETITEKIDLVSMEDIRRTARRMFQTEPAVALVSREGRLPESMRNRMQTGVQND